MKKILLVLAIAVLLGGGGALYFIQKEAKAGEDRPLSADEMLELSIDTDQITTNLATPTHYAVVQFNILLDDKKTKAELEKRQPEVRAAAIAVVSGMEKDELIGGDGIGLLESEMTGRLQELLPEGTIDRVLVTEFKVQ